MLLCTGARVCVLERERESGVGVGVRPAIVNGATSHFSCQVDTAGRPADSKQASGRCLREDCASRNQHLAAIPIIQSNHKNHMKAYLHCVYQ